MSPDCLCSHPCAAGLAGSVLCGSSPPPSPSPEVFFPRTEDLDTLLFSVNLTEYQVAELLGVYCLALPLDHSLV